MQFQIPQFIDVEDKIFGPFTFKQFVYVAGGAGISFVIYKLVSPFFLALIIMAPIIGLSLALTFYRVNNRPFIETMEAIFHYGLQEKLYIWKKRDKKIEKKEEKTTEDVDIFVPRLSESKLKDIAWSLDVQESLYAGQDNGK